ncbi:hypothetical protein ACWGJ9_08255 [Curtobacterium citreum]
MGLVSAGALAVGSCLSAVAPLVGPAVDVFVVGSLAVTTVGLILAVWGLARTVRGPRGKRHRR